MNKELDQNPEARELRGSIKELAGKYYQLVGGFRREVQYATPLE